MTGAFFRVKRNGKFESVEIEHLTSDERANLLKDRDADFLLSCLDATCDKLRQCEQLFDELVEDGVLNKDQ